MDQNKWLHWKLQTATKWKDIESIFPQCGIEKLDLDHKRLIELILNIGEIAEEIGSQCFNSEKVKELSSMFDHFMDSVHSHFDSKMYFIDKYQLPDKETQIAEHKELVEKFELIRKDFEEGILSTFKHMKLDILKEFVKNINGSYSKTFAMKNFIPTIKKTKTWDDLSEIIKSTGIPFVDKEHKILTSKILVLKDFLVENDYSIESKEKQLRLFEHINDINKFTSHHFAHEIDFLKTLNLSVNNQNEQHAIFMKKCQIKKDELATATSIELKDFIDFLVIWWVEHINGVDFFEFHFSRIMYPVFNVAETITDLSWLIRKTNRKQIDDEHARFLGILIEIRQVPKSTDENKDKIIHEKLIELYEFGKLHFEHEEIIIRKENIKGLEIQHEKHGKLLELISSSVDHIIHGRAEISTIFFHRLLELWLSHTNGIDYDTFIVNEQTISNE